MIGRKNDITCEHLLRREHHQRWVWGCGFISKRLQHGVWRLFVMSSITRKRWVIQIDLLPTSENQMQRRGN